MIYYEILLLRIILLLLSIERHSMMMDLVESDTPKDYTKKVYIIFISVALESFRFMGEQPSVEITNSRKG
jgi:hypothetical protein